MRRRRLTIAISALLAGVIALVAGQGGAEAAVPASAAPAVAVPGRIDIVKVSGLIDPLNADLVSRSLRTAADQRALLIVLQVNSPGGTISSGAVDVLAFNISHSPVPVAIWVGGSGRARAYGPAFTMLRAADFTGEAPGSRIGNGAPPPLQPPDGLEHATISGDDAVDKGIVNVAAPTLVSFLGDLSGHTVKGVNLQLGAPGGHGFRTDLSFNFSQLSILPKLLHTAASPTVAFVMLLLALSLFVFEFFTAGVGVAAGTGLLFGVLAAYGLGTLPTRPVAVGLLMLSVLGFAIDVQAGAPRFWTAVAAIAFVAGALSLYRGQAVAPWVIVLMGVLLALFMVSGMPAMVRTRFSTPTIGRDRLIGTMGVALSGVDPEGTVDINGASWRARTNRATPIPAGEAVRVVAIDGLLLEVEPQTGGARDAHH